MKALPQFATGTKVATTRDVSCWRFAGSTGLHLHVIVDNGRESLVKKPGFISVYRVDNRHIRRTTLDPKTGVEEKETGTCGL